ncbi:MAG TPA: hypothetical protein DDZ96_07215 [Porphyromonadaceae bacterium]|jgi:glucan phosphoethanolaminetransferase (alkaline phosphatase superfamily)|nr:hypothetical protein [Porphyromonadaceae bacterium]HBL33593.1 hypothetical protein [Porphyromonadaceae bacterium]HBX19359.1 hypothetical protein [Porphyromonadaceae bacterium]HCM20629.1 hypothetical protein [Porphyromonadaceae bacterium]
MLQRVQTVFLLGAFGCMVAAMLTMVIAFSSNGITYEMTACVWSANGQTTAQVWVLPVLGTLAMLLPLIAVFLYKKRKSQIRLAVTGILAIIAYYAAVVFAIYGIAPAFDINVLRVGAGAVAPLAALALNGLAIRRIRHDEALIRSLNRLR